MKKINIKDLQSALKKNIDFWDKYSVDHTNGGFYGSVDYDLVQYEKSERVLVLNARMIWGFSAVFRITGNQKAKVLAHRAYNWFMNNMWDKENYGAYYSVSYLGELIDDDKWAYGQAFVIYALAEYYNTFKYKKALEDALKVHEIFEKYIFDGVGCREKLTADWKMPEDPNTKLLPRDTMFSMNTHLHVLEAYTNLTRVAPQIKPFLAKYIDIMTKKVLNNKINHYNMYFNPKFKAIRNNISFGHDIEGGWLMFEAAEVLGDAAIIKKCKKIAIDMTRAQIEEGYTLERGLVSEADGDGNITHPKISWWEQAETAIGCINAYQLSGKQYFYDIAVDILEVIDKEIVNPETGAWKMSAFDTGSNNMKPTYISGWKAPYHNVRMYLELIERLEK